jgi:hypothetical protein
MRKKLHSPWAVIALALAASACTSRTTPLPPPELNSVSRPGSAGDVTVVGLALEGASVAVINERTLEGAITTPEQEGCRSICEFRAKVQAESGDALRVWQFFDTEGSIDTSVP